MPKRQGLTKKCRFEVFKRDGFICQYCGSSPPLVILEVDHIVPVSKGGTIDTDNLITACFNCNRGKGARPLSVSPESVSQKAEILKEKVEQLKAYERLLKNIRNREKRAVNELEKHFTSVFDGYIFGERIRSSIQRVFLKKLPKSDVLESLEISCGRFADPDRALRYFCGICWRKIREAENV